MTEVINSPMRHGDRLEVGDLELVDCEYRGAREFYMRAIHEPSEDPTTYVVIVKDLKDDEPLDLSPEAELLDIIIRQNNAASVVALMPVEAYQ